MRKNASRDGFRSRYIGSDIDVNSRMLQGEHQGRKRSPRRVVAGVRISALATCLLGCPVSTWSST